MTAPVVWILVPATIAIFLLVLPRERLVATLGTISALALAGLAYWIPPDTAQRLGSFSLRIDATLNLFGRQISLTTADQTLLIIVYGLAAFWFFGTLAVGGARQIVPLGLAVIALLVASLAVQPFLYAAMLIEMAVLVAVPLLARFGQPPGRGLIRFLIYQTLAMPFILLAGFLLSGVEAGPGDAVLIAQAAVLLAFGFAFLLAIFPLNTWIPQLAEETSPYSFGFILTIFPTFGLVFGLSFIDRYSWLRDAPQLLPILQTVGLLTAVSAGLWAAFQRHLGRIAAYAVVAETGLSILAISLPVQQVGLQVLFYLLIPRALALGVWMLSITVLQQKYGDLRFHAVHGLARRFPVATAGVVFANLALAGTPLLAAFPVRQVLWQTLAGQSLPAALWFGLASLGLWISAFRSLAVLTMAPENTLWQSAETWWQRGLIGVGLLGLFLSGIFPQWAGPLLANLPAMFEHLGK